VRFCGEVKVEATVGDILPLDCRGSRKNARASRSTILTTTRGGGGHTPKLLHRGKCAIGEGAPRKHHDWEFFLFNVRVFSKWRKKLAAAEEKRRGRFKRRVCEKKQ